MPSSTFSSDRIPPLPYGRLWPLALVLVVLVVVGLEITWRQQGHRASIIDDTTWWAMKRQSAAEPGAVVLTGASRLQLGFAAPVFRERYPDRPLVRLEVAGRGAFEVLLDLAEDETFQGTVICSTAHSGDVGRTAMTEYLVAAEKPISLDRRLNRTTSAWLRERLVFLSEEVGTHRVLRTLMTERQLPQPRYVRTLFDRSRTADFDLWRAPDSPAIRRQRVARWAHQWGIDDPRAWPRRVTEVKKLVDRIESRGGQVVFACLPISDPFLSMSRQAYPRRKYWNQFVKLKCGVPVHFMDLPTAPELVCPDSSHLDEEDAPRFTVELLDELERRGVFQNRTTDGPQQDSPPG